jgi:hypothetical protein
MRVPLIAGASVLEVLQPVELPGLKLHRRQGRADHHFDDGRRQARDFMDGGIQLVRSCLKKSSLFLALFGAVFARTLGNDRVTLFGAAHGLHHVAEVGGCTSPK